MLQLGAGQVRRGSAGLTCPGSSRRVGKPLEYPVRTRAGVWASRLVARPKSFVKILEFFFADFDVSSYLKIEIFLENFWIFFFGRLVGRWVEWGSGWAALGSSWTEAGLQLGVGSSRTWLKLSWRSTGMGWAEAQAGLKLKLGLNIPGGRRGEVRKKKIGHISKSVSSYEMGISPTQVCHP